MVIDQTGYGIDLGGTDDVAPSLGPVTGRLLLAQACVRRLITPYGSLWYDTDYGHDVRQYLSAPMFSPGHAASGIALELEKDPRVERALAVVSIAGSTMSIRITVTDGGGPFEFVVTVDALRVLLSTP